MPLLSLSLSFPLSFFTLILIHCLHGTLYRDAVKLHLRATIGSRLVRRDERENRDVPRFGPGGILCFGVATLLASSIAPHFAEHIRRGPADTPAIEAGTYNTCAGLFQPKPGRMITARTRAPLAPPPRSCCCCYSRSSGRPWAASPRSTRRSPCAVRVYIMTRLVFPSVRTRAGGLGPGRPVSCPSAMPRYVRC
jgi:hypothetical protein